MGDEYSVVNAYDGGAHRDARQKLRDIRAAVDELPENDRAAALCLLHDVVRYAHSTVASYRDKRYGRSRFSEGTRVLPLVRDALAATVDACATMFEPETDPQKMIAPGSSSDFETDLEALEDMKELFHP
jgi:hypothetical protein